MQLEFTNKVSSSHTIQKSTNQRYWNVNSKKSQEGITEQERRRRRARQVRWEHPRIPSGHQLPKKDEGLIVSQHKKSWERLHHNTLCPRQWVQQGYSWLFEEQLTGWWSSKPLLTCQFRWANGTLQSWELTLKLLFASYCGLWVQTLHA